jgi:tetratricopeptide (TPR) repeat protein
VTHYEKWTAVARSIEGFKQALYHTHGSATEAHVASARIDARLGRWQSAIGEYRIALADNPSDVTLWMEFGQQAAAFGRDATAREAYSEAARLSPSNPEIAAARRRLDEDRQNQLRTIQSAGGSLVDSKAAGD